jgi:hypothetical protein
MKPRPYQYALIAILVFVLIAACNLTRSVPSAPTPAQPSATQPAAGAVNTQAVVPSSVPATLAPTNTLLPSPPAAVKSPLHWGKYSCPLVNCISDKFLDTYKVIGGVPPLEWFGDDTINISVRVDEAGTVTAATAFFWIITNHADMEACTRGEYQFSDISASGSYNIAENKLTLEMLGDELYTSWNGGVHCAGSDLAGTATKEFIFAVNADGNLVLCQPGETGNACLANPMAVLSQ